MKTKFTNFYSEIIALLIAVLGFSGCDSSKGGDEYGTPHATLRVRGTVVDKTTGKVVEGIRAVAGNKYGDEDNTWHVWDTTYTNSLGQFEIGSEWVSDWQVHLKLEDVDGEKNGSYEESVVGVSFSDVQLTGGKGWYRGEGEKDLGEIAIEEKTGEANPED